MLISVVTCGNKSHPRSGRKPYGPIPLYAIGRGDWDDEEQLEEARTFLSRGKTGDFLMFELKEFKTKGEPASRRVDIWTLKGKKLVHDRIMGLHGECPWNKAFNAGVIPVAGK